MSFALVRRAKSKIPLLMKYSRGREGRRSPKKSGQQKIALPCRICWRAINKHASESGIATNAPFRPNHLDRSGTSGDDVITAQSTPRRSASGLKLVEISE